MVVSARAVTTRCVAVKVKPLQAHVFAVADDRHPTLRVLFEAFTFARHVCEDQLGVQRIVVVLN